MTWNPSTKKRLKIISNIKKKFPGFKTIYTNVSCSHNPMSHYEVSILTEKDIEKKNPIFSIKLVQLTSCKRFKICFFILFKKIRLGQGIRRPKATDSPLLTIIHCTIINYYNNYWIKKQYKEVPTNFIP